MDGKSHEKILQTRKELDQIKRKVALLNLDMSPLLELEGFSQVRDKITKLNEDIDKLDSIVCKYE